MSKKCRTILDGKAITEEEAIRIARQELLKERQSKNIPKLSAARMIEAVDTAYYLMYESIQKVMEVETIAGLSPDLISDKHYNDIVSRTREEILQLEEPDLDNHIEEILAKVKRDFNGLGFFKNTETEDLGTDKDLKLETYSGKIYDKAEGTENGFHTMKAEIHVWINSLYKQKFIKEDRSSPALEIIKNSFGFPVRLSGVEMHTKLTKLLEGASSLQEMISILEEQAVSDPNMGTIVAALKTSDKTTIGNRTHNNFKNAFYNLFSKKNMNQVTSVNNLEYYETPGEKTRTISSYVTDTNKIALSKIIKVEWLKISSDVEPNIKVIDDFNKWVLQNRDRLKAANDFTILKELSEFISTTGIDMNLDALIAYKTAVVNRKKNDNFHAEILSTQGSIKTLLTTFHNGNPIFTQDSISGKSEIKIINRLAFYEAKFKKDFTNASYLSSTNSQMYPFVSSSRGYELIERIRKGDEKTLTEFENNPITKGLKIIEDVLDHENTNYREDFSLKTLEAAKIIDEYVEYGDLTDLASYATKFNMYWNDKFNNNPRGGEFAYMFSPNPADKGNQPILKLIKARDSFDIIPNENKKEGEKATKVVIDETSDFGVWLKGRLIAEANRIKFELQRKDSLVNPVENYHVYNDKGTIIPGNAYYFNFMPFLNEGLYSGKVSYTNLNIDIDVMYEKVKDFFVQALKDEMIYMQDLGIIKSFSTDGKKVNMNLDLITTKLVSEQGEKYPRSYNIEDVYDFVANTFIINYEQTLLFSGDIAFNKEHILKNITKKYADINKRMGQSFVPGNKLSVNDENYHEGAKPTFQLAIIATNKIKSEIATYYTEFEAYGEGKIDWTDASGLMTLDRLIDILIGEGQYNKAKIKLLQELKDGKVPNQEETKLVFEITKGFLYTQKADENGVLIPMQVKYSTIPLIPSFTKRYPALDEFRLKMENEKVDEAVFDSGIKIGVHAVNDNLELPFKKITMDNKEWRRVLETPTKDSIYSNFGSQLRKLITSNITLNDFYKLQGFENDNTPSGEQLKALYQNSIIRLLTTGIESVTKNVADLEKVVELIKDQVENNSARSLPEIFTAALQMVDGDTKIPLSHPAISQKAQNILLSYIDKKGIDLEMPGIQAVQASTFGMVNVNEKLLPSRFSEDGTEVLPGEAIVTPQYFINSLIKKGWEKERIRKMFFVNGELSIDKVREADPDLLKGILYRIPTQAKNSMMPFIIKEFALTQSGAVIYLPVEFLVHSGSDFDIDKVFIEFYNFKNTYNNINYSEVKEELSDLFTVTEIREKLLAEGYSKSFIDKQSDKDVFKLAADENVFESFKFRLPESIKKVRYKGDLESASKSEIQNLILDIHYSILTNPKHFREMITPNSIGGLENIVKTIRKKREKAPKLWIAGSTQNTFEANNKAGKNMTGVWAVFNTGQSISQDLGVELINPIKVNGRTIKSLSEVLSNSGEKITDQKGNTLSASVDNTKDPVLGYLNINYFTSPLINFFFSAGEDYHGVWLVNQPIILELTKAFNKHSLKRGKKSALDLAIKELKIINTESSEDIRTEDLIRYIEEDIRTPELDAIIVNSFLYHYKIAEEHNQLMAAFSIDSKGMQATIPENIILTERFDAVMEDSEYFKIGDYSKHSINQYRRNIGKGVNMLTEYFPDGSGLFREAMEVIKGVNLDYNYKSEEYNKIIYSLHSFIHTNSDSWLNTDKEYLKSLYTGEKSLRQRLKNYIKEERAKKKTNPAHEINSFINGLELDYDKASGIHIIKFNNTATKALTADQKNEIINIIYDLWKKGTSEETLLVEDLIRYTFFTNGFNRSTNNFIDFIHSNFYVSLKQEGVSLIDFYKDKAKNFENVSEDFNINIFVDQFLRNNYKTLNYVQRFKNLAELVESKAPYGKIGYENNSILYKKIGDKYIVLPPLGYSNLLTEYSAEADFLESILDSNKFKKSVQDKVNKVVEQKKKENKVDETCKINP